MNKDRFKFRVWNKQTKKYMKNMVVDKDGTLYFRGAMFPQNPSEYIIEQCTGLKDKNGNLIYEGDILSCDLKDVECATGEEIHYKKQGVVQRDKNGKYFIEGQDWYGSDITFYNECAEIIGNIHEQKD